MKWVKEGGTQSAKDEGHWTLHTQMSVTWKKYKINRKQIAKIKVNSNQRHRQQQQAASQEAQDNERKLKGSEKEVEVGEWHRHRYVHTPTCVRVCEPIMAMMMTQLSR